MPLVFPYTVLFLIPSSLGKAVFDRRALTLAQGQLTQNKQIAKLPLWSGAGASNMGRRRRQQGQEPLLSSIKIFLSSSKIPFLNTSGWKTTAADSLVLVCIHQSMQRR